MGGDMKIIRRPITEEFKFALADAYRKAKQRGKIVYVCQEPNGDIVTSYQAPEFDSNVIVLAKCWPGGRRELKFIVDDSHERQAAQDGVDACVYAMRSLLSREDKDTKS